MVVDGGCQREAACSTYGHFGELSFAATFGVQESGVKKPHAEAVTSCGLMVGAWGFASDIGECHMVDRLVSILGESA